MTSTTAATQLTAGPSATTWLAALRVVTVGRTTAARSAADALRTFGAHVEVVDGVDPNRTEIFDDADIVLVDRVEAGSHTPIVGAEVATYLDFVSRTNRAVWVTASTFGLETDRADAFGSDVVALAAGGVLGHSRVADGAPTIPAGRIALKLLGVTVAMAALHGIHLFRETNRPVHMDVSAQGAVVASGLCLELAHALGNSPDEGGSSRYGAPTGFFSCAKGQIYLVVLEQHQWQALQATLSPALDDLTSIEDGRRSPERVNQALEDWASTRSNLECERVLQDAGVPCTAVNSVEEYLARAEAAGRPLARTASGIPAVIRTSASDQSFAPQSLRRLRVLDAGHVLAVPLATAWLGAMGAHVTKLEDLARLDVYRRRGPFIDGVGGINRSAYFTQVNYCKHPAQLTVTATGSDLDLDAYDVVVHNLSPRRARAVGVDGEAILGVARPRLSLSSSGFGGTGSWADYRAYGHNIHAFAGLVNASRDSDGGMADVGTPWADPLTGAVTATWILAWSLAPRHDSATAVDLSMTEVMAAQLVDLAAVDPDQYYASPQQGRDLFIRFDDGLVAVSLRTPEEARAFEEFAGAELPAEIRRGADFPAAALGSQPDSDPRVFAAILRDEGIVASFVEDARTLAHDGFFRSTGILQPVHSPTLGDYTVTGLPWSVVGQGRSPLTSAPELP